VSVESPETENDVPNFVSTAEISQDEFKAVISAAYPDADLSAAPETWIGRITKDSGGRVETAVVGGAEISGAEVRRLLALRSAAFSAELRDGSFVFTVTGFGHGVGMSQYGANVFAKGGMGYMEILAHYYPGTEVIV
jgi:stage II sporulation protein D